MIISVTSAMIGLVAMIAAALAGASSFVLALVYILSAVPTLILILRAMLRDDIAVHSWNCEIDECFAQFPEGMTPDNKAPCGPVLILANSRFVNGEPK
jgi:hypothetical protein